MRPCAAGGRYSKAAISATVEKREDQRKPDAFFGHRKAGSADRRPPLTVFPPTSCATIPHTKTERSNLPNWQGSVISAGQRLISIRGWWKGSRINSMHPSSWQTYSYCFDILLSWTCKSLDYQMGLMQNQHTGYTQYTNHLRLILHQGACLYTLL